MLIGCVVHVVCSLHRASAARCRYVMFALDLAGVHRQRSETFVASLGSTAAAGVLAYHTLVQAYYKATLEYEYETSVANGLSLAKADELLDRADPTG